MTTESPSEFVDIFPTLCELARIHIPARVEGLSLVPILDDPNAIVRKSAMEQYPRKNMMGYTLRDTRYRYIKWVKKNTQGRGYSTVVATELYDYTMDPLETVNQAANPEYAAVIEKFEAQFRARKVAQKNDKTDSIDFLVMSMNSLGKTPDVFAMNQRIGRGINMGNMFESPAGEPGAPGHCLF